MLVPPEVASGLSSADRRSSNQYSALEQQTRPVAALDLHTKSV